jgi:hypothetical protein
LVLRSLSIQTDNALQHLGKTTETQANQKLTVLTELPDMECPREIEGASEVNLRVA